MSLGWYDVCETARETATAWLIAGVKAINRWKDRTLSQTLFDLAERYNTRPGTMNYTRATTPLETP